MAKFPLTPNTRFALQGRVVTMNDQSDVLQNGVVYIEGDTIKHVLNESDPAPDGFSKSKMIRTSGTIFPGLIELHNHLSYNILPLWNVPDQFVHHSKWKRHPEYKKFVTGPMKMLGKTDGYIQSLVRYVECKLLFSGVTTSQGITLNSNLGIQKFYKGIVRNVEQPVDADLPRAKARIGDVKDAADATRVKNILSKASCYLLHLAEGTNPKANDHFKALRIGSNDWAITDAYCGIHALGLNESDFQVLAQFNGSMVWSPCSNLLLYGKTAKVEHAKAHGIKIGLGSDWSPSGSKNLLCELKMAKIQSEAKNNLFSDEELVRMATTNAAQILKWDHKVGSLEAGRKADIIVVNKKDKEAYEHLIEAREEDLSFVMIDGLPRFGWNRILNRFDIATEQIKIGRRKRALYLHNESPENLIDVSLKYKDARSKLKSGLLKLESLAKDLESQDSGFVGGALSTSSEHPGERWTIAIDHCDHEDEVSCMRHHVAYEGEDSGGGFLSEGAVVYSEILKGVKIPLDPPTILDDPSFFKTIAIERNLNEIEKTSLADYYGVTLDLSQSDQHLKELDPSVQKVVDRVISMDAFYRIPGQLDLHDRLLIIDQAITMLRDAYVHLRLKQTMHASNPLMQLEALKKEQLYREYSNEIDFHKSLVSIFNSIRDLHTTYYLPRPYNEMVAFLPIFIEEYFEDGKQRYIASKKFGKINSQSFKPGVEIVSWNGIPIKRAIALNGERFAGSNQAARFARGLDSLTLRPLSMMLPPEEDKVYIEFRAKDGRLRRVMIPWRVASIYSSIIDEMQEASKSKGETGVGSSGYDYLTQMVHYAKKHFLAPKFAKVAEKTILPAALSGATQAFSNPLFPAHMKVDTRTAEDGTEYGYLRVYSFDTNNPRTFALDFKRLVDNAPKAGLVLDLRNNGGGNILAAECMLQALTPSRIEPAPAQFVNSQLIEHLLKLHSPSPQFADLDLRDWNSAVREMRQTGSVFSLAHPITPKKLLKEFKAKRKIPVILITDALCYSATDIFAAGFQDHNVGPILGVHDNTGAGGANVWTHGILHMLTRERGGVSPYFKMLPEGANMRVAVRRTLRVGSNAGIPLEDLGVEPSDRHEMTQNDLLFKNRDLIKHAYAILSGG